MDTIPQIIPSAEPFLFPGNKTGCLLVHGFTGTPKEMLPLGKHLHSQGYSVLGVRLAGHATKPSDMVRSHCEDWLLSVEEGYQLLTTHCQQIVLIGLSMGGMLSQITAARFPVQGLVMMSTPYNLPEDWRMKFVNVFKYFVPGIAKGESDWDNPENAKDHISYPQYPTASLPELIKVVRTMHATAKRVQIPVLLVQSSRDATVPLQHAQQHYEDLGSNDKEIFMVEKSGHIITRDSEREKVFEKVTQFIQKVSATLSA